MKRRNEWLAVLTVGSGMLCLYALFGMAFYQAAEFYIPLLIGSSVVGLPFWIRFVRVCIRNRKDK
jgi:hypothetical protein